MFRKMAWCLGVGLVVAACDGGGDGGDGGDGADGMTDAEIADALWDALDGFESWSQRAPWTGVQFQSDGSPHGPYVQIWLDDVADGSWDDATGGGAFADGSILVKRIYDTVDGQPADRIFAMQKIDGYATEDGDWFWAEYDGSGAASQSGALSGCQGCHSSGDDYSRIATDMPGTPPT